MIKSIIRTLAFMSNWTAQVLRQPSMVLWMIGGPFLVLFLFGIGSNMQEPPPPTIVVNQSQASGTPLDISPKDLSTYLNVTEVTVDLDYALSELQARKVNLVLVIPPAPAESVQNGQRAIIKVYVNEIDPVRLAFMRIDVKAQLTVLNEAVEKQVIDSAKTQLAQANNQLNNIEQVAGSSGVPVQDITTARQTINRFESIPSDVLVSPFDSQFENIAPINPSVITFFTPAALALVIQHLAVTLAALSMVRIRLLGGIELWQTAPIRLREIIAGNYLSYGILILLISAIIILAVTWALAMPILGSLTLLAVTVVLLVFASLAYGFVISLIASTEQIAAQIAMIILLASIFLGGFVVPLEQILMPVRIVSLLLPATYGAQLLQNIMVRGEQGDPTYYVALAAIGVVGMLLSAWLLRRELKPS